MGMPGSVNVAAVAAPERTFVALGRVPRFVVVLDVPHVECGVREALPCGLVECIEYRVGGGLASADLAERVVEVCVVARRTRSPVCVGVARDRLVEQEEVRGLALRSVADLLPEAVGTPQATSQRNPSTTGDHSSTTSSIHRERPGSRSSRSGCEPS